MLCCVVHAEVPSIQDPHECPAPVIYLCTEPVLLTSCQPSFKLSVPIVCLSSSHRILYPELCPALAVLGLCSPGFYTISCHIHNEDSVILFIMFQFKIGETFGNVFKFSSRFLISPNKIFCLLKEPEFSGHFSI